MNFHATKKLFQIVPMTSGHRTKKLFSMGFESLIGLGLLRFLCPRRLQVSPFVNI